MRVNLDRSLLLWLDLRNLRPVRRNLRLRLPMCQIGARSSQHVDLIDIDDYRFIDVVVSRRGVLSGPSGLCNCATRSYAARPVLRQDVNKLCIDDSKLQIDDSTLQIDDLTLQIGDSTLQIGDSKCATVAYECDGAVTQRHPDAATLKSNHSKSQERGVASWQGFHPVRTTSPCWRKL